MASNYQVGNLELRITSYANTATTSLGKMNTQLDKTRKVLKNVGITATFGKINYMVNMMRYYGRAVANVVQYAMDYVETLNLWQVANRENIDLADEFISKMNKAYGVSEQTLMNYQAIFKNMLAALGDLSDAVSSQLSMQLTQMALDFSSLYNVTIERAMTVYQSILSGQVRPVRSISGMDITENTIFDMYQQAGGEKTVRQLSQIEKRLLRIAAIFDQMGASGAIGDMEKTIESASNQARVMGEQLKEVLTWTGQIILLWLNNNKVFQYINAALMTMKEIVKSIAFDLGYEEQNFLDGMITQAEGADEALDEVQGKLLSFDKFEALNSADSNVLGIDPVIEDLIANINLGMNEFKMKATEISEEWLKILGFEYNVETGLWEMSEGAENLLNIIKSIGAALLVIAGYKIGSKIFSSLALSIMEVSTTTKGLTTNVTLLGKAFSFVLNHPIVMLIAAIVALLVYAYNTNEQFRESVDAFISSLMNLLGSVLEPIMNIINQIFSILGPIIELLADLLASVLTPILDILTPIIDIITKLFDVIGYGIAFVIEGIAWLLKAVVNVVIALINLVIDAINLFLEPINAVVEFFGGGSIKLQKLNYLDMSFNIPEFASGGFPEEGQLFVAREAGPEMVGSMGGRTTVANNDQIVEGISQGVYEAVISANSQNNQQLTGNVYIDGSKVGKVVARPVYTEGVRIGVFKKA